MQSNGVLKILCGAIVCVVLLLGYNKIKGDSNHLQQADAGPAPSNNLDAEIDEDVLKNLGIEGDTVQETLNTVVAKMNQYEGTLQSTLEENSQLKKEIRNLRAIENSMEERILSRVSAKNANIDKTQPDWVGDMTNRINSLEKNYFVNGNTLTPSGDIPTGIGITIDEYMPLDEIVWIDPVDAKKVADKTQGADGFKLVFPEVVDSTINDAKDSAISSTPDMFKPKSAKKKGLKPFFTIPANATLIGSVSMSALLGRIPIDGAVTDPYPVKFIVGPENLASNSITIPSDISGIVMSGMAKGDWTLSCASADIYSMTFTFNDGTIVTLPEPLTLPGGGGESSIPDPIAWISDKYGIPCVTGKRITNAPAYIGSKIGLGALSAYATAMAQAETTTTINSSGGSSTSVTGDSAKFALNTATTGATTEVLDWVEKRMQQSFDAIYVPPGVEVVIHPTAQLEIDYDPNGRKVKHYANQVSSGVRSSLD